MVDPRERFLGLPEHAPDAILLAEDGGIVFANLAARRLFGWGLDQPVAGPAIDLFHPDHRPAIAERLGRWMAGEGTPPIAATINASGGAREVEVAGAVVPDRATRAVQLILRDTAGRKHAEAALRESEERLTLAFAGAQEGVWDWNLETGSVVYSPRWKEMLGYSDPEIEPHVSAWERLLHPEDRAHADQLGERVKQGSPTYEGEFRLRHKDGHYVHVLTRGLPIRRDPGGPVVRIVGTHFDLTERRKADAERARTELLARLVFAQEDERRRIAREMHDQFGEQLTALEHAIQGLKGLCRDRPIALQQVEALERIAQALDRDVDHLVWELRPTALDDLGLRAALTNYVQDWSKRVGIPAELHASGLVDDRLPSETETTLYRIAQEALTNVAKHSRAGHVEVILERRADHVLLVVEDDGIGFEPVGVSERHGFGLLGMQERAALVGATIEIESSAGNGTTILLRMAAASPSSRATDHG